MVNREWLNPTQDMLLDRLTAHAERIGEKPAIVAGDRVSTYRDLVEHVYQARGGLERAGIGRSDRVLLAAERSPNFVAAYLACHAIGAIAVPLDPASAAGRREQIEASTGAKLALGLSARHARSFGSYEVFLSNAAGVSGSMASTAPVDADSIADLLFTTGTTGKAKGVMLTHGAIEASAKFISEFLGQTQEDIEVVPLPLAHSFGLGRLRCSIFCGSTIVLVPGFSDPTAVVRALRESHATGFASVPAGFAVMFQMTGDAIGEFRDRLRFIEIGSSAMDSSHKRRLMELLPRTRICMHYGLTEASRSAFIEFHEGRDKLDSVGRPSPGVTIEILDANDVPAAAGEVGRIAIRSIAQMAGYWDEERGYAGAPPDRVLTGDLGRLDEDGYLYLVGRESDVINVGGRKVSPEEIESLLRQHPAIEDCACVAMEDPGGLLGHVVRAFFVTRAGVPDPSPKELARFLRGRIEPFKMPRAYDRIEALPRTASGKVRRRDLVES